MINLGVRLQEARHLKDWTLEQAAEAIEPALGRRPSRQSLSQWEHGRKDISVNELMALTEAFDLPLTWWIPTAFRWEH